MPDSPELGPSSPYGPGGGPKGSKSFSADRKLRNQSKKGMSAMGLAAGLAEPTGPDWCSDEGGPKGGALSVRESKNNAKAALKNKDSDAAKQVLKELFCRFDPHKDGTGNLKGTEFFELCQYMGLDLTKSEVKTLMRQIDLNGDGLISLEEFHFFFGRASNRDEIKKQVGSMVRDKRVYIRKLFGEFKSEDTGGIAPEGFYNLCKILHFGFSRTECHTIFKQLDAKSTGFLPEQSLHSFLDNLNSREELKELLRGMTEVNDRTFVDKLYHYFDSTKCGKMLVSDLRNAADFCGYPMGSESIKKLVAATKKATHVDHITLEDFRAFFNRIKSVDDFKHFSEDFDKSDARKKKTMLALALMLFGGAIAGFMVGQAIIGAFCLVMSVFIILQYSGNQPLKLMNKLIGKGGVAVFGAGAMICAGLGFMGKFTDGLIYGAAGCGGATALCCICAAMPKPQPGAVSKYDDDLDDV